MKSVFVNTVRVNYVHLKKDDDNVDPRAAICLNFVHYINLSRNLSVSVFRGFELTFTDFFLHWSRAPFLSAICIVVDNFFLIYQDP